MTELNMKTDARALRLEPDLQERRLIILKGISRDLTDREIAAEVGVDRWTILRDMISMRQNNDDELKDAVDAREKIRDGKTALLMQSKAHVRQEKMFLNMTGMTLQEKSFQNMVDFYMSELRRIMKARDQSAAIRALSKKARRTLLNNGILKRQKGSSRTWRITESAQKYMASLSRTNSVATS
jgi:hypothetical protein